MTLLTKKNCKKQFYPHSFTFFSEAWALRGFFLQVKSIRRFSILIYPFLHLPVAFRHLCNTFWFWWLNEKYDSEPWHICNRAFWFWWLNEKFYESMRTHCIDGIIAPHVCHPSLFLCVVCDVFLLFFHIHLHITLFGS